MEKIITLRGKIISFENMQNSVLKRALEERLTENRFNFSGDRGIHSDVWNEKGDLIEYHEKYTEGGEIMHHDHWIHKNIHSDVWENQTHLDKVNYKNEGK